MMFVSMPILTRLYEPAAFGVLAVYAAIVAILGLVAAGRWELAIPLARDPKELAGIGALAAITMVGSTAMVTGLLFFFSTSIMDLLSAPELLTLWPLIPVGILGASAYQVMSYWAVRRGAYGSIGGTTLLRSTVQVGGQVGFFRLFPGGAGLVLGQMLGQMVGAGHLARRVAHPEVSGTRIGRKDIAAALREHWRFPVFSGPASLMNVASRQGPALVVAGLFGAQWAGWYTVAERVVAQPMRAIGNSTAQVFYGEVSSDLREGSVDRARRRFLRVSAVLFVIGLVPALLLFLFGPVLFRLAFGPGWEPAAELAGALAVAMAFQLAASPVSQTLNLVRRQSWVLVLDGLRLVLTMGVLVVVYRRGGGPVAAVQGYAAILALVYVMSWVASWLGIKATTREGLA